MFPRNIACLFVVLLIIPRVKAQDSTPSLPESTPELNLVQPDSPLDTTEAPPPQNDPGTTALSQEAIRQMLVESIALQLVDNAVTITSDPDLDKYTASVFAGVDKQILLPPLIKDVVGYLAAILVTADPSKTLAIQRAQRSTLNLARKNGRK